MADNKPGYVRRWLEKMVHHVLPDKKLTAHGTTLQGIAAIVVEIPVGSEPEIKYIRKGLTIDLEHRPVVFIDDIRGPNDLIGKQYSGKEYDHNAQQCCQHQHIFFPVGHRASLRVSDSFGVGRQTCS